MTISYHWDPDILSKPLRQPFKCSIRYPLSSPCPLIKDVSKLFFLYKHLSFSQSFCFWPKQTIIRGTPQFLFSTSPTQFTVPFRHHYWIASGNSSNHHWFSVSGGSYKSIEKMRCPKSDFIQSSLLFTDCFSLHTHVLQGICFPDSICHNY